MSLLKLYEDSGISVAEAYARILLLMGLDVNDPSLIREILRLKHIAEKG